MKAKYYLLFLLAFYTTVTFGQTFTSGQPYAPGSTITNGEYEAVVMGEGHLVINKKTQYGSIRIWQFPSPNVSIPAGTDYFLVIKNQFFEKHDACAVGLVPYKILQQDYTRSFMDSNPSIVFFKNNEIHCSYIFLSNDGNLFLYSTSGQLVWRTTNSAATQQNNATYPQLVRQNADYIIPGVFEDEYNTTFFAAGKFTFPGTSTIVQKLAPLTFTAKEYIEFLPGFTTDVTGSGAFIARYMACAANSPISSARIPGLKQKGLGEITQLSEHSNLSLFPNPSSKQVYIRLAEPGDNVKYIQLFDNAGRLVAEYQATLNFDISHLPNGSYHYQVTTEKGGRSFGILVKH